MDEYIKTNIKWFIILMLGVITMVIGLIILVFLAMWFPLGLILNYNIPIENDHDFQGGMLNLIIWIIIIWGIKEYMAIRCRG